MEIINKIVVVDDHDIFRDGIASLLRYKKIAREVFEAKNGKAFLELLETQKPDVVLLDIAMPVMDGVTAAEKALKKYPDLNIVVLSMYDDEDYYYKMINAGVKGFILKSSGKDELQRAIKKAFHGENYYSGELLQKIIQSINTNKIKKENKIDLNLTPREKEVLDFLCSGLSAFEIAEKMHLSKKTIEGYRTKLFNKTHTTNSVSLVVFAIKNKIVNID